MPEPTPGLDPVVLNRIRIVLRQLEEARKQREQLLLDLAKVENTINECNSTLQGIAQASFAKKQGPSDLRPQFTESRLDQSGHTRTTLKYDQ